ncbi:hypothetical protein [Bacillus cereus]|uniref:DUF5983 family protein n=1 Tax=Bacillus cereus TaxID=1396 RepID=UPI003D00D8C2
MLEVSTVNITEATSQWLVQQAKKTEDNKMDLIVYEKGPYGVFIPIYTDMFKDKVVPDQLVFLVGYAVGKGCYWIMIDRDAEVIDDLPTYDW